ncbi:hypothetical protein LSH36_2546g00004 [Paralvinella palmiformis]|uniref:Uncharacterized protein n=1 Tax=Paralvinella palmiformis TaxID=53620 RepID=A0AAD9IPN5_9ANNE|nr:hypothetical protein LSH36_2546g00004 [Paralvinella palmiformis]
MSYKTQYHPSSGEYWKKAWECKDTIWHVDQTDSWLDRNLDILTAGREEIRIFLPLSGKAKDLKWYSYTNVNILCAWFNMHRYVPASTLADKGHHVVGAEVSPLACQQFFSENDIPHTVIPFPGCNGSLYKSNDGKIEVYCCNIFDFNKDTAGVFDAIWDKRWYCGY